MRKPQAFTATRGKRHFSKASSRRGSDSDRESLRLLGACVQKGETGNGIDKWKQEGFPRDGLQSYYYQALSRKQEHSLQPPPAGMPNAVEERKHAVEERGGLDEDIVVIISQCC